MGLKAHYPSSLLGSYRIRSAAGEWEPAQVTSMGRKMTAECDPVVKWKTYTIINITLVGVTGHHGETR